MSGEISIPPPPRPPSSDSLSSMGGEEDDDSDVTATAPERARKKTVRRVTSVVFLVFGLFAAAFVVSTTYQIAIPAFFAQRSGTVPLDPSGPCAIGIRGLVAAMDRGLASAAPAVTDSAAIEMFNVSSAPEWDHAAEVEETCRAVASGPEAFASVLRVRQKVTSVLRAGKAEIAPLRREIDAYLSR